MEVRSLTIALSLATVLGMVGGVGAAPLRAGIQADAPASPVLTLNSTGKLFGAAGAAGVVQFTVSGGTPAGTFTIESAVVPIPPAADAAWLVITDGDGSRDVTFNRSGFARSQVKYRVLKNATALPREAILTIGTQNITVSQKPAPCTVAIAPAPSVLPAAGGDGSFEVSAPEGCGWEASVGGGVHWLGIVGGLMGAGNGIVAFSGEANETGNTRAARIRVTPLTKRGKPRTHTVTQESLVGDRAVGIWANHTSGTESRDETVVFTQDGQFFEHHLTSFGVEGSFSAVYEMTFDRLVATVRSIWGDTSLAVGDEFKADVELRKGTLCLRNPTVNGAALGAGLGCFGPVAR